MKTRFYVCGWIIIQVCEVLFCCGRRFDLITKTQTLTHLRSGLSLYYLMLCRILRIHRHEKVNKIILLKLTVTKLLSSVYFNLDCAIPLGLQSGKITEDQITASSSRRWDPPRHLRLHYRYYWCPRHRGKTEFVQVDLGQVSSIWCHPLGKPIMCFPVLWNT